MSSGGIRRQLRSRQRRLMLLCAASIAVSVFAARPAVAQDTSCELSPSQDEDEVRYRQYDDRCEGLYTRKVASGESLAILGFHWHDPLMTGTASSTVDIWAPGAPTQSLIRIVSLRRNHYYQMDARQLSADGTFSWHMNVVKDPKIALQKHELGGIVCAGDCKGTDPRVYYALSIAPSEADSERIIGDGTPYLLIKPPPGTVKIRVTTYEGSRDDHVIFEDEEDRRYDNNRPVRIAIETLPRSRECSVLVEARLRNGGTEELRATLVFGETSPL